MKKILGLDLGTNSIGWALIEQNFEKKEGKILGMGSRIIPMDQGAIGKFAEGGNQSQTEARTGFRSSRRLRERYLLRRERLHRVLNTLGFLPEHFANQIDFKKRFGQFYENTEPKLAYNGTEFLFKNSFNEMLIEFRQKQPLLFKSNNEKLIPYDWTIYYLRKKALDQKIEKEELAWIILNFNQKRGYYQLRGEEEEDNSAKSVEFYSLKVIDVVADEKPNSKGDLWYSIQLENGWIYRRSSKISLNEWKGKVKDFIVTSDLNSDGTIKTDKYGIEKRSFRSPGEDDWTLIKKKTEQEINNSYKTVGSYIYDTILKNPNQKINGKLVRTIERKFYKDELKAILKKQIELHSDLFNEEVFQECIFELYRNNIAHQSILEKKDFIHLIVEDIIFYQRPLKSQKSTISNCSLEYRVFKKKNKEGFEIEHVEYLKAIPKSHPLYQEFRVWQWMHNLKIYRKEDDFDVTTDYIKSTDDYEKLFEFLMSKKEVDHKDILKFLIEPYGLKGKALSLEINKYRWNYVYDSDKDESKKYPCNETGYEIRKRLEKVENIADNFLNTDNEIKLWHLLYSVTNKEEYEKALKSFAQKNGLNEITFFEQFRKYPPFKSDYGTFSEKAIKKMLPLLRIGKYWVWDDINTKVKNRIQKIISGEFDDQIKNRVREKALIHQLNREKDFQGLPLWLAQYIVYNRHSEAEITNKWNSITDLEKYLSDFKQHSLRNPIVEQVITETLRVVKDIWVKYGNGSKDFFNEIHIELGRDMKNTKAERERLSKIVNENENTNLRIKALLIEIMNDNSIENVRPYSPSQQEILKIYEEYALICDEKYDQKTGKFVHDPISDEIQKISKKNEPTKSELQRYKLWLEQRYRSPYTGQPIPLSKLFTSEYQIEHIIPQSRFFDDGFSNKVICESAVNKLKDKQLGLEFIKNHQGEKVSLGFGNVTTIFTEEQYLVFIKDHYAKNRNKRLKLLLEEVPEKMILRQLNDTRYISKFVCSLLSNIVRAEDRDDGVNSKNIILGNGKITSQLKQDWGLNDVWNDLILPRFERMNNITNSDVFTVYNENYQKYLPSVPFEFSKGFQKKRIDHRHHSLDALIIACTTRDHINLLNNQAAKSETTRIDLQNKLRLKTKWKDSNGFDRDKFSEFKKPWQSFTEETRSQLEKITVSFKQNLRIINKATNTYESYTDENGKLRIGVDGKPKKGLIKQKGLNWAIRKPLHKDTVSGMVNISWKKAPNGKYFTASRKSLDPSFDLHTIKNSITDTGIQKILEAFLEFKGSPEIAFSPEGIEEMNANIIQFNNGKKHQPIYKVRVFELGSKFSLGSTGNKGLKYVETAKGTNLFFSVYENKETKKRMFETVPLNEVIEHQKQQANESKSKDLRTEIAIKRTLEERGKSVEVNFLFTLSPNDLVYVPYDDENLSLIDFNNLTKEQTNRIYKMVSSSGSECFFVQNSIASLIKNYDSKSKIGELGSLNKLEVTLESGVRIKEKCIKIKVNRIGDISI